MLDISLARSPQHQSLSQVLQGPFKLIDVTISLMSIVILVPSRVASPSIAAARLTLQEALRFTLTVTNVITRSIRR